MSRGFDRDSSQYLEGSGAVVSAAPLTIACWIWTSDAANYKTPFCIGSSSESDLFAMWITDTNHIYAMVDNDGSGQSIATTAGLSTSTWGHAAVSFDASNLQAYLNGGNKGSAEIAAVPDALDLTDIGARINSGSRLHYWDGVLAEIGVWNTNLTDAEVAVLATGVSPLMVRPQNLIFYLPLVRDNDEDIVGGLSLTAYGSPTIATHPPVIYPAPPMFYGPPAVAAGYTLTANQGSYTLSGQTASPLADRKIAADQGSYSLSGQATALLRGYLIAAAQGSYSLTGQAAGLLVDRLLGAAQGSYTLTGQDADLLLGFLLTADQGSYTLTGQTTGLLIDRLIAANQGSYTLTGQDANLLIARLLTATQGSYSLTGQDVTLTYTPVGGYTIVAESGSYALSGQTVDLLVDRLLTASQGSYTLSGQISEILKGFYISAAQGSYTLTGQAAELLIDRLIVAAQGSYTLSGQDVELSLIAFLGLIQVTSRQQSLIVNVDEEGSLTIKAQNDGINVNASEQ